MATRFPVRGFKARLLICWFMRTPGGMLFEQGTYRMELQAKLDDSDSWTSVLLFPLHINQKATDFINKRFLTYDNNLEA